MDDHRVIDIEAKLAYQEVLLNQMSDVLYQQQQQIDLLSGRLSRILERLQQLEAGSESGESDQELPPPHY